MKSTWSYEVPPIEDVIPFYSVYPRGNSKSFRDAYKDYLRYVTVLDDIYEYYPITDTFLWSVMEKEANYIGSI